MSLDKTALYSDWLEKLLAGFNSKSELDETLYENIWNYPEFIYFLIDKIANLAAGSEDTNQDLQASYLYGFSICLTQFKSGMDAKIKHMERHLIAAMDYMAEKITTSSPNVNFWMLFLNAYYDCQIELSPALKDAYFNMMEQHEGVIEDNDPLESLAQYLEDLDGASTYEKADNIFVQGYAMPAEYFTDLVYDLIFLEKGRDVAILALLHPNAEVRGEVMEILHDLRHEIKWTAQDLLRLRMIRPWLSDNAQLMLEEILHEQRLHGGIFAPLATPRNVNIYATEIDGAGGQGIIFCWPKSLVMAGVLLKQPVGIKDAWCVQLPDKSSFGHYLQSNTGGVTLKEVELSYIKKIFGHFLALTKAAQMMPPIHYLEIQEKLGVEFKPEFINLNLDLQHACTKIYPFNDDLVQLAKNNTRTWLYSKSWAQAWYVESEKIDHIIIQFSRFDHGKLLCDIPKAVKVVMRDFFATIRPFWAFHFYWVSLWLAAQGGRNLKNAEYSAIIAYLLITDCPIEEIPILKVIAKKSLEFCIKTLQERKAYLNTAN
jgi:hypothetical protein